MGHMVEHAAYAFHAGACLLKRGVIYDEAVRVVLLLGILLTDYAHEADGHAEKKFPPVHGRAVVHPVEAVLARLEQSMEFVGIERADAFMAHAEQAQQHYQQRGGNSLLLLHFQAAERPGQLKAAEECDNICVHAILLEEYVVYLVDIV